MSSIYNESFLGGIANFKKWLFRFAVGLLVFAVVLGGLIVLVGESSLETAKLVGQFMGTVIIIGIMMLCTTWDIKLIESRKPAVQVLATIGLGFNLLWAIFWIVICWFPEMVSCSSTFLVCEYNPIAKIASVCTSMSAFGLLCGAIMNMYEGKRKDIILPLKITTAVLLGYELIFATLTVLLDGNVNERFTLLSGYAGALWFIMWLVTLAISGNEKKKDLGIETPRIGLIKLAAKEEKPAEKTDEEIRKEVEERLRREQIEKEVRAEMEKEKVEKKED